MKSKKVRTAHLHSEEDAKKLLHELQVHQFELEMQNEELRRAKEEIEAGIERYADFFDFSLVGHLALDSGGVIREANLTIAALLGVERSELAGGCTERIEVCAGDFFFSQNK